MQAPGVRLIPIVFAMAFSVSAASQTVLESLLDDLSRYFGAAARLTINVIAGVETVQAGQIPAAADRQVAVQELQKISREISLLRASQTPLVFDIGEYVTKVRGNNLDAEQRGRAWRSILSGIDRVSPIVHAALQVVETSRWLKVALNEDDRLALRQVLMGRGDLLDRLRALQAPSTAEEIDRLDSASQFYRQLMMSLDGLNAALLRATDRLKPG